MDFDIVLDKKTPIPIYFQIVRFIKNELVLKNLGVGDRLPSIRKFAKILSVNPGTISKAYSILEGEDIVVNRHGIGVFISSEISAKSEIEKLNIVQGLVRDLVHEAYHLGISRDKLQSIIGQELAKISDISE